MAELPIVVAGGSSGTGRRIVELLHQQQRPTRVLSRNISAATRRLPFDVEVVFADLTRPETLATGLRDAAHIVVTAGVYSGRPATRSYVKAVEFDGVVNVLRAVGETDFRGRFLYLTASGLHRPSPLNLWKGNTLKWRLRVEDEIRRTGLDYAIIRVGVLFDRPRGWRPVQVTQEEQPLSLRSRISREDVAAIFVASLDHPAVSRTTFEVVGQSAAQVDDLNTLLSRVRFDAARGSDFKIGRMN